MLIAIATDAENVSPHFGRCQTYTLVEIVDGNVKEKNIVGNPGHSPGAIPQFLNEKGAKRIVCGGMGPRAMELFKQFTDITHGVRRLGAAAIDLCHVACGKVDGF